jgi:hypothetical protein
MTAHSATPRATTPSSHQAPGTEQRVSSQSGEHRDRGVHRPVHRDPRRARTRSAARRLTLSRPALGFGLDRGERPADRGFPGGRDPAPVAAAHPERPPPDEWPSRRKMRLPLRHGREHAISFASQASPIPPGFSGAAGRRRCAERVGLRSRTSPPAARIRTRGPALVNSATTPVRATAEPAGQGGPARPQAVTDRPRRTQRGRPWRTQRRRGRSATLAARARADNGR